MTPRPPEEAIRFFESKGFQIGFDWRDVWAQEHARAFTVAKVMRYDILQDIRQAVDASIRNGTTFEQFRSELTPVLQQKGWWGRKTLAELPVAEALRDQVLGETTGADGKVQLGSPRRLRIIYDTNLRTARAAGRWARMERLADRLPFLRYSAVLDGRTRPLHRSWHGTVLRINDRWWQTHYPPNGWNCRCIAQQFSADDLEDAGFEPSAMAPNDGSRDVFDKRNQRSVDVPRGIDLGFSHNIGQAHMRSLTPLAQAGEITFPRIVLPSQIPPWPGDTAVPAGRLFRSTGSDAGDAAKFMEEFGATPGRPTVFTDAIGEPVVIDEAFFQDRAGVFKIGKRGRRRALLLLADTIKDPSEIWWNWIFNTATAKFELRRTYLKTFDVEGDQVRAIVGAEIGRDGWVGTTAFAGGEINRILNRRNGVLAFSRRTENEPGG